MIFRNKPRHMGPRQKRGPLHVARNPELLERHDEYENMVPGHSARKIDLSPEVTRAQKLGTYENPGRTVFEMLRDLRDRPRRRAALMVGALTMVVATSAIPGALVTGRAEADSVREPLQELPECDEQISVGPTVSRISFVAKQDSAFTAEIRDQQISDFTNNLEQAAEFVARERGESSVDASGMEAKDVLCSFTDENGAEIVVINPFVPAIWELEGLPGQGNAYPNPDGTFRLEPYDEITLTGYEQHSLYPTS